MFSKWKVKTLPNEKESFIVYSLFVSGLSNWSQNLASLLVVLPIADKIRQNDAIPSSSALWILAGPCEALGLEPDRYKEFFLFFFFFFRNFTLIFYTFEGTCYSLFYMNQVIESFSFLDIHSFKFRGTF